MKVPFVFALALAVVAARPDGESYSAEEDDDEITPYQFSYSVGGDYAVFSQSEEGDEENNKSGEYSVNLPDGRVQTVKYYGDHEDGFSAEVSYDGEAFFPETESYEPEEEEDEEEEEEEEEEEPELIPIYAYRQVYE